MDGLTYAATLVGETLSGVMSRFDSPLARLWLLTIGLQESKFTARRQSGDGPARGFWQFERAGGVRGVMTHPVSRAHMQAVCQLRGCPFTEHEVWSRLETDDVLACAAARLLLLTDPFKLPAADDPSGAWLLYANRVWRPGKPHLASWPTNYVAALGKVSGLDPIPGLA